MCSTKEPKTRGSTSPAAAAASSWSATRISCRAPLRRAGASRARRSTETAVASSREHDLGAQPAPVAPQVELAAQLVGDKGPHDRETRSLRVAVEAGAVVGDGQREVVAAAGELDPHMVAAVLERVLQ